MPDSLGLLTKEEQQKALSWLEAHGAIGSCPACHNNRLVVGEHLVGLTVHTGGMVVLGGPSYPAVLVTCARCGYFRLHSAMMMGLVQREPERESKEVKSGTS